MITLPLDRAREIVAGFRHLKLNKSRLPVLRCLLFSSANGSLEIRGTTLDESLLHRSTVDTALSAGVLVPFDDFSEVAKAADAKSSLTVTQVDEAWQIGFVVASQPLTRSAALIPIAEFPPAWEFTSPGIPLAAGVLRSLRDALDVASRDPTRLVLNGVNLGPRDIVATNGRQLYASNSLNLPLPEGGLTLPATTAWSLFASEMPADLFLHHAPDSPGDAPTHAALGQGNWTWAGRLIEGNYPRWSQVVPREETMLTRIVISDADAIRLQRVLPRLPGASERDAPVTLVVDGHTAKLRTSGNGSAVEVTLDSSAVSGPGTAARFNRTFLTQALAHGFRTLLARDAMTPLLMRDGPRCELWMPVRIDPPPAPAAVPVSPEPQIETQPDTPMVAPNNNPPAGESVSAARNQTPSGDTPAAPTPFAALHRAKELVRELQGALSEAGNAVRDLEREKRAIERDLDALKRNLRALKSVEV